LIALVKYIHLNPIRAGVCKKLRDYPWSSDGCYRTTEPGFVKTELLLDMLSQDRKKSLENYTLLMENDNDPDINELIITENKNKEGRIKIKKIDSVRKPLDEILKEAGIKQEELELIKSGSRLRRFTSVKNEYAKSASKHGYSLNEIACHIGVSSVAVFKYISRPEQ